MSDPHESVEDIQAHAGTQRRAIVVKALMASRGGGILDWINDAKAILDALDEDAGDDAERDRYEAAFSAGAESVGTVLDEIGLTPEQEVRLSVMALLMEHSNIWTVDSLAVGVPELAAIVLTGRAAEPALSPDGGGAAAEQSQPAT